MIQNITNIYLSILGRLPVVVLILLAASAVIIGDYAAKAWSIHQKESFLFLAFVGYFFSGFFYIPTLMRENLIITSILWTLMSTIGFLIIGFIIFKEVLSVSQIIAVLVGLISIIFLTFFK